MGRGSMRKRSTSVGPVFSAFSSSIECWRDGFELLGLDNLMTGELVKSRFGGRRSPLASRNWRCARDAQELRRNRLQPGLSGVSRSL
jgi:hypothetical protein